MPESQKVKLDFVHDRMGSAFAKLNQTLAENNRRVFLAFTPESKLSYEDREEKRNNRFKALMEGERIRGLRFVNEEVYRARKELGLDSSRPNP